MNRIILNVENLNQWFVGDRGETNRVLYDINLKVAQGQFVGIVGGSGCGKTTLLKTILGTDPPKEGVVEVDGMLVRGPNRHVGMVYQQYSLYDFLNAEEQVMMGLKLDQTNLPTRWLMPWKWLPLRKRHRQEAQELLAKFRLSHATMQYPNELSGGMKQRVSIAQSLIMKPKLLLLDEPFSGLDESIREKLREMLLRLYAENLEAKKQGLDPPWTVLFVTHDLDEAFYVSDRVFALGKNWYEDTPAGKISGETLGATKLWDKSAPVYTPDEPKNFDLFFAAKRELRESIINEGAPCIERSHHVSFWEDLANGVGTGVCMIRSEAE